MQRGEIDYLGYQTLDFVANGAQVGTQHVQLLAAAHAYLSAGYSIEQTTAKIRQGLQNSPCGDASSPWTEEQALALVRGIARRKAPPLPRGARH